MIIHYVVQMYIQMCVQHMNIDINFMNGHYHFCDEVHSLITFRNRTGQSRFQSACPWDPKKVVFARICHRRDQQYGGGIM